IIMGIGDKGVILYIKEDNSLLEYKPVKTNEIVNTIGAGNALFSSFLHYYVKTKDAKEAIKNALLFASYKIGFVGTSNGFMTEEQIEQWKKLIWM
ncbi:MAG: carbohydrate kinase family protein, partial [Lachnospiraceae bacterium]|nr:carbohydrate kinase family protein [Lachnospiraceae bacterium]